MRLCELAAENFLPFEAAVVRLPEQGLVLVAGANNTGKTALLSAFDVVAGVGVDTAALRHAGSANPARVAATFALTAEERASLFAQSDQSDQFVASGAASRLQLVFEEQGPASAVLAEVRGEWPGRGLQTLATTGSDSEDNTYGVKVIRGLMGGEDSVDPLHLMRRGNRFGGPMLLESDIGTVSELSPVVQLLAAWRSRYYHFRTLRPGTQRSTNLTVAPNLEPTGQNLAAVLLDLLTNRVGLLEELRRLIAEIVPDIGRLEIRTSGSTMRVVFTAGGVERNLKDLGTGVEQILLTLVVGLTEAPPFTMVIEEPETNLHSAAQRALVGLLKAWSIDRQIVAATHSPVILDWSPGGERLWHVTRTPGVSKVEQVRDDPSALLNSLGVRLSDVLSADRVLVLEGPSDEEVLGVWFPEVLRNPNVALVRGGGGDNARHADRLAEWLASVDRIGLRRVLYLCDRDELSPSVLKKLEDSKTVGVLGRRELENYLLDPAAVAAVFGSLVSDGATLPSAGDVAAAMSEAAEGLRRRVVINRVCRQVGPTRPLMEHALRRQLADAGAAQDGITTAVLERLMSPEELSAQIAAAWEAAESDVISQAGEDLLAIAPGEEILNAVFQRFAGRHYNKRRDGVAIAKAMSAPPDEIRGLLEAFMVGEAEAVAAARQSGDGHA